MNLPSEPSFHNFKKLCVCCEETGKKMNKEHIYPLWLLKMTHTEQDLFASPYGKIPAISLTVPLCEECNSRLGKELEAPVSLVFESIENGDGFNDYDAELLVRWIWKINGMFYWSICNDHWKYGFITLKEHVLSRIVPPRSRISIAISLIEDAEENFGCSPVGIDSFSFYSNIYAVGVFSKICIVVFRSEFTDYFDKNIWTVYTLSDAPMVLNPAKRIYPKYGFSKGSYALGYVKNFFGNESQIYKAHELLALEARSKLCEYIESD